MAKTTIIEVTDDLDGSPDASEVTFALDGTSYSIDLGEKNAGKLRDALAPYIEKAQRLRGAQVRSTSTRTTSTAPSGGSSGGSSTLQQHGLDAKTVREWAKANGHSDLKDRGRIPESIVEEFLGSQTSSTVTAGSSNGRRRGAKAVKEKADA